MHTIKKRKPEHNQSHQDTINDSSYNICKQKQYALKWHRTSEVPNDSMKEKAGAGKRNYAYHGLCGGGGGLVAVAHDNIQTTT